MEFTIGTAVFNDWVITEEIGQGATGRVYKIKKNVCGEERYSALKVITIPKSSSDIKDIMSEGMTELDVTDYFKEFVDEILREIKIMVSLKDHPNIVTYEGHCVIPHDDEIGWDILIKMELLTPLTKWQMDHPMDEKNIIQLGCEISSALAYASDHNLIHRDVKPENIFVDSFGRFKLGDFGIARTIEKTTGGLSKKGTESYMAPEVFQGKKYNGQVDVYALGLVLYRFLNNSRLPFYPPISERISYSDRENALIQRMKGTAIPEPVNGSAELKAIVLKACEYLPEKRFTNMNGMHNALQKLKEGGVDSGDYPPKPPKPPISTWKKIALVGVGMAMGAFVFMIASLMIKAKEYTLTVENGSGSGKYEAGSRVKITADDYQDDVKGILEVWMDPSPTEVEYNLTSTGENEYEITMPEQDVKVEIKNLSPEEMVEKANAFLENKQYEDAVRLYQVAAEHKNAEALYQLALCYYNAYGVKEDKEKTFELTRESAELGYADAQYELGWHYYTGEDGFTQDYEEAVKWFKKAADQNDAEAQCNLAVCYLQGYGEDVDITEVVDLFKKAADQKNAVAEYYLGWCYEVGYGVDVDEELAHHWYKEAADQGLELAEDAIKGMDAIGG